MKIVTAYNVRFKTEYVKCVKDTVHIYTDAVRYLVDVVLENWEYINDLNIKDTVNYVEPLVHATDVNPNPVYAGFDRLFPKFPSYLRRDAISKAKAMCKSYKSNLLNWENADPKLRGKKPHIPTVRSEMPAFYKKNMFIRTDTYTAKIKLYIDNDWKYVDINLSKSDVDYILHHCAYRKECAPVLRRKGKNWELSFAFVEKTKLHTSKVFDRVILAVDLGINNPCTCSVMTSDGTVLGRHFYKAPVEEDSLNHKLNKIKKAQQHGSRRMPRLWAAANGVNAQLSFKTAQFIIDIAVLYNVDVIVFEYLNTTEKKRGSKKQRLHMWRKNSIQNIVTIKAHRLGMRISHVCARNTSKLAYDGSGKVERGTFNVNGEEKKNYSICTFQSGKQYNCDLNATYNIGARYFIREILKSLPEKERLDSILAEVPELSRRSTCTWSSLISLNAVLAA